MRISEIYHLQRGQSSLDFVDIDPGIDVQFFIDPSAIRHIPDSWGEECTMLLATFFDSVLDAVKSNDRARASYLLLNLSEPNETHLGFSHERSAGRGFGPAMRQEFLDRLYASAAARTGLIEDLEDTSFFIDGVGVDIVSDITTNIIRGPLIAYTQQQAAMFDMPLEEVDSGPVWDAVKRDWERGYTELPLPEGNKVILVPKVIVRRAPHLSRHEYYTHHLIPAIQAEELANPASRLAQTVRGGGRIVTKKSVKAFYGDKKADYTRLSLQRPSIYRNYKAIKAKVAPEPVSHREIGEASSAEFPNFKKLLESLLQTPTGTHHATEYHRRAEGLLSALFYPSLSMPEMEEKIHQGRKRVDIAYTNTATRGFFRHLTIHKIPSRRVFVECKNYSKDLANSELDQLAGRFGHLRGKFGILAARSFDNKNLFLERCRDTALDGRGHIILLDDEDMKRLVADAVLAIEWDPSQSGAPSEAPPPIHDYPLLYERLRALEN